MDSETMVMEPEVTTQPKEASLTEILAARGEPLPPAADARYQPQEEQPEQPEGETGGMDELSELEQLRAQVAFLTESVGESVFQAQKPAETTSAPTESVETNSATQEESLLAPRKFEVTEEELEDITLNGNGKALQDVLSRQADVIQHNLTVASQAQLTQTLAYALPTYLAAARFEERNPELSMMPNADAIIQKTIWDIRKSNPQASDAQLLRLAEKQLRPAIDKAKSIVAQGPKKKEVGASQQPSDRKSTRLNSSH
mgnify:FL=1